MATVIRLDPARRPPARPRAAAGPAEIVLFTGIRYERASERLDPAERRRDPERDPHGRGRGGKRRA